MLLLMRCKIIKLPVLKIRAKRLKTSINKEQRLPAASNLNEFDTLMSNICNCIHMTKSRLLFFIHEVMKIHDMIVT
jgi:hypothetical protein